MIQLFEGKEQPEMAGKIIICTGPANSGKTNTITRLAEQLLKENICLAIVDFGEYSSFFKEGECFKFDCESNLKIDVENNKVISKQKGYEVGLDFSKQKNMQPLLAMWNSGKNVGTQVNHSITYNFPLLVSNPKEEDFKLFLTTLLKEEQKHNLQYFIVLDEPPMEFLNILGQYISKLNKCGVGFIIGAEQTPPFKGVNIEHKTNGTVLYEGEKKKVLPAEHKHRIANRALGTKEKKESVWKGNNLFKGDPITVRMRTVGLGMLSLLLIPFMGVVGALAVFCVIVYFGTRKTK